MANNITLVGVKIDYKKELQKANSMIHDKNTNLELIIKILAVMQGTCPENMRFRAESLLNEALTRFVGFDKGGTC